MGRASDLAYWINEREYMRMKKEGEIPEVSSEPPYSVDPNMAGVRYCNVHREDDRVTRWIAQNWRNPNADSVDLTLAMVAARMINWPDTLEELGYPYHPFAEWARLAKIVVRSRQAVKEKAWTSAYTISTCGRSMPKEDYVFDHVLAQVAALSPFSWEGFDLSDAHKALTYVDGLGSFLAAQVVADLKNTPGHPLSQAPDYWTWSAPGPGSLRGLEAYYGQKISPSGYHGRILDAYNETMSLVYPYVRRIHMQDFQNCLCEFSKYIRVKEGDGRVRNKYNPG